MFRLFGHVLPHEKIFNFFHAEGVETVCLTLGSQGVKLSQKHKEPIELPAIEIENIMDTTGAGDAFNAGFLYGWKILGSVVDGMRYGSAAAALNVQHEGACSSPQTLDRIEMLWT